MSRASICRMSFVVFLLMAAGHVDATPESDWQIRFGVAGILPIGPDARPRLQRDPTSGSFYVHNVGQWPLSPLAAKLDPYGAATWSVLERTSIDGSPQGFLALADGSIITAHYNVTRYAADGSFLWSAPADPGQLLIPAVIEAGTEILRFSTVGGSVSRVDRQTGVRVETLHAPELASCGEGTAVVEGSNTVYWIPDCGSERTLSKLRLAPLRIEWSTTLPAEDSGSRASMSADAGGVHVTFREGDTSSIARFAATDGSTLWSVSGAYGDAPGVALDTDGHPLVFGASVVEKLDRATGARHWLHTVVGRVAAVEVAADAIVVAGNADSNGASGFAERLRSSDGSSLWQTALMAPAAQWMNVTSLAVQGNRVLVAGVACAENARPERCDLTFWPRTIDGSGSGSATPNFTLPATGRAAKATSDTTIAAALEYGPVGMQLRVKRVRNADGEVLWDAFRPVFLPNTPGNLPLHIDLAVSDAADGAVAVLYRTNTDPRMPHTSDAVVAAFDAATGAFRWERSVIDTSAGYTDGLAPIIGVDDVGNVFVSVHEGVAVELTPMTQSRRQIRKLAAATGQTILSIDFGIVPGWSGFNFSSLLFRIVGGDILAEENPLSADARVMTRIGGTSGSSQWSNPELPFPYPWGVSVLEGEQAYVADGYSQLVVSKIALGTGATSWTASYTHPSDMSYAVSNTYRGSDGAIYAGGFRRIPRPGGSPSAWDSRGLLMRLDDTGGAIDWVDRFDTSPVASPSGVVLPVLDHDGVLYSWQRQSRAVDSPGHFYTATSAVDGALMGTQAVYLGTYPFPHLGQGVAIEVVGTAIDGGTVVQGGFGDSSQPFTFGIAKWPAPQPFAGGALRVSLTASAQTLDWERIETFIVEAANDGSIDAPDVDVLLAIPARSMVGPVTCVVDNVPCTAKVTSTSVGHRLDLPVGARVRISGSLRHPWESVARLEASAFSPYGFVEMDMKDNIRSLRVDDILFSHGFD